MLTVGCDLESSRASVELAASHPTIYAAVGIHPHDAAAGDGRGTREAAAAHPYRKEKSSPSAKSASISTATAPPASGSATPFAARSASPAKSGLPIIVHDRDAHDEVLAILREEKANEVGGVLHCFSGDLAMARACLDLGFYHLLHRLRSPTRKTRRSGRWSEAVPIDRMLVETDCPYLAPQPHRGRRNEPAYVRHTAETIAEVKGLTLEDVARITTLNAFTLFGIGEVDQTTKIAYQIRHSLYLNITNRCTNACIFCAKFKDFTVKGHHLRLDHEPSAEEVIRAIGDPTAYEEVVFCGYGEPLIRLDLIKEVAAWLKAAQGEGAHQHRRTGQPGSRPQHPARARRSGRLRLGLPQRPGCRHLSALVPLPLRRRSPMRR